MDLAKRDPLIISSDSPARTKIGINMRNEIFLFKFLLISFLLFFAHELLAA
jgi:hypothetical protein